MRLHAILRHTLGVHAARLPLLGLGLGALGGVLYTLQSAPHMVVEHPFDKPIVGLLLALLGAGIGWLTGILTALPLRSADPEPPARPAGPIRLDRSPGLGGKLQHAQGGSTEPDLAGRVLENEFSRRTQR